MFPVVAGVRIVLSEHADGERRGGRASKKKSRKKNTAGAITAGKLTSEESGVATARPLQAPHAKTMP